MKTLFSALVLTTLLTSTALAGSSTPPADQSTTARPGPVLLTETQLDTVTAGNGGALGGGGVDATLSSTKVGAGIEPCVDDFENTP